jgi:hypothetical protein
LMSSKHPLGVQGIKQSLRSPLASFPALTLVNLKITEVIKNKGEIKIVSYLYSLEICTSK